MCGSIDLLNKFERGTRRSLAWRWAAGVTAFAALLLAGCSKGSGGGPPPDMPTEVVIEKPSVMTVEDTLGAVGTVEANERVELKPETSGIIASVNFVEGQRVKRGDNLFEFNSRKEAASVAQAEAEEKLARANVERARTLIGTKAISQQEVDQLESQVAVKAALRQVEKERLIERRVDAPFDGVVGPRLVSPGQYVSAGASLVTLVDYSQVKVQFRIPERQLSLIRPGQTARLRVSAYPDDAFTGKIDLVDPEVDPQTRTVEVRLIVPNPDGLLKPGMFARVELVAGTREGAVVIPESAVIPSLDRYSVYVVQDGVAKLTPITLGIRMPGKVEVREGLSPDQPIVVNGAQKLTDGMKVVGSKPATLPTVPEPSEPSEPPAAG